MKLNRTKRIAAAVLLALLLCFSASGCVENNPRPEDTIKKLQTAINGFDLDSFLSCVDSKWSKQIEAICDFTVGEGGLSVDSFITLIKTMVPILPFGSGGAINPEDFPQVDFVILRTDISGDTAIVDLAGILTCGDYHNPFTATVEMQLENDVWVISGIR